MYSTSGNPIYTNENQIVWHKIINEREIFFKKYEKFIYEPYLDGFDRMCLKVDQLPTIESLTSILSPIGWKPVFVNGYLSTRDYVRFLSKKQVPISSHMRSLRHLQYALAPDLIHDLIGHVPMLFCNDYVEYLVDFCECYSSVQFDTNEKTFDDQLDKNVISQAINELDNTELELIKNSSPRAWLSKLFLWTIEFGLIQCDSVPKIYGAGLMSSTLEAEAICKGNIPVVPFSLESMEKDFHFSDLQDQVFVADSFVSLRKGLSAFKNKIIREI